MILWKLELVGMPILRRSYSSEYCATSWRIGMVGLRLGDLLLQSGNRLPIIAIRDRRDCGFERTGFLDALRPHVFQEFRPDFCLFDQIEKHVGLGLVDCASVSVVIIADD